MTGVILAIDQGTTNTKALAIRADGTIVAKSSVPMSVDYPRPGWAEQSALALWQSVQRVIAEVAATLDEPVAALAISNQRETIVLWDAMTGEPVAPAVIWQCRRSADRCAALREAGHADEIEQRTGLGLDPLFPAAKLGWLLDAVPGARARAEVGELRAGTVDAWLLWNLTGGTAHRTDHSNASRTQLFATDTLAWDSRLGELFDVPLSILPEVLPSDSAFGLTAAGATALPAGVPIQAMMGDSHAALFGHGVRRPGTIKATYGTGSSLMTLTERRVQSQHGLSGTIAWSTRAGVSYALEGNISVSGQAAAFMSDLLGLRDLAVLAELATSVESTEGVVFVPALAGLGAPHWRTDARGTIAGMSLGTRPAHLARATIEAIAFQVADVVEAMAADLDAMPSTLSVDGGASRNDFLMQFQADVTGLTVRRGDLAEVSAVGAASMAAQGIGWGTIAPRGDVREFRPALAQSERAAARAKWQHAIAQATLV